MTRGLVGAAPPRCLVLPWAGEHRPPVGCVMLVCAGGLGQRGAPAWRRRGRSGWGAPFGALALWLIPLGRRCHSPLSSRPLRCGQLRQAACPLRAGVDTSPVAGCPSAARWVELPPVGGVLPSMPLQRRDQQRSAAATPTVGGRRKQDVKAAPSARPCAAVAACKRGGSRATPCVAQRVQTRGVRRWGQAALGRQRLVHTCCGRAS